MHRQTISGTRSIGVVAVLAVAGAAVSVFLMSWVQADGREREAFWRNWERLAVELFVPGAFALVALAVVSRRARVVAPLVVACASAFAMSVYLARDVGQPLYYDNPDALIRSVYAGAGTNAFATGMLLPLSVVAIWAAFTSARSEPATIAA